MAVRAGRSILALARAAQTEPPVVQMQPEIGRNSGRRPAVRTAADRRATDAGVAARGPCRLALYSGQLHGCVRADARAQWSSGSSISGCSCKARVPNPCARNADVVTSDRTQPRHVNPRASGDRSCRRSCALSQVDVVTGSTSHQRAQTCRHRSMSAIWSLPRAATPRLSDRSCAGPHRRQGDRLDRSERTLQSFDTVVAAPTSLHEWLGEDPPQGHRRLLMPRLPSTSASCLRVDTP